MKRAPVAWWGVPGWGQRSRSFEPLRGQAMLAGIVELPGHASTPHDPQVLSNPTLHDWALDLLQQLPSNQSLNLLGWSLGGMVALAAASLAPERIARVAVMGSGIVFARREEHPTGASAKIMEEYAEGAMNPGRLLKRFFALATWGVDRTSAKTISAQVLPTSAEAIPSTEILQAGLSLLVGADLSTSLSRIQVPVLVLHGMRDRVCHPDLGRALAQGLAATTEAVLAIHGSAAHAPHWSHPEWVALALHSFAGAYGEG